MSSAILNITEQPIVDESIEKYEFHEYEPVARSNLNSAGEIRIDVEKQDLFTHPSESYILFEGRLTKADGTAYANTDAVALTNNGLMHLFSQITYSLANQQVESVYHPGQATTMLGMLTLLLLILLSVGVLLMGGKITPQTTFFAAIL